MMFLQGAGVERLRMQIAHAYHECSTRLQTGEVATLGSECMVAALDRGAAFVPDIQVPKSLEKIEQFGWSYRLQMVI